MTILRASPRTIAVFPTRRLADHTGLSSSPRHNLAPRRSPHPLPNHRVIAFHTPRSRQSLSLLLQRLNLFPSGSESVPLAAIRARTQRLQNLLCFPPSPPALAASCTGSFLAFSPAQQQISFPSRRIILTVLRHSLEPLLEYLLKADDIPGWPAALHLRHLRNRRVSPRKQLLTTGHPPRHTFFSAPGSTTRPLSSINAAISMASGSTTAPPIAVLLRSIVRWPPATASCDFTVNRSH